MSKVVTPAQAGVQKAPQDWIPAFADFLLIEFILHLGVFPAFTKMTEHK
jgi:hypothetical protein